MTVHSTSSNNNERWHTLASPQMTHDKKQRVTILSGMTITITACGRQSDRLGRSIIPYHMTERLLKRNRRRGGGNDKVDGMSAMAAASDTTAVHCITNWRRLGWKHCNIWHVRTREGCYPISISSRRRPVLRIRLLNLIIEKDHQLAGK